MRRTVQILKFSLLSVVFFLFVTLLITAEEPQFEYLQEFEGLHITGVPFDFDMQTYRFTVTGKWIIPLP
jgi:hypothetical protein